MLLDMIAMMKIAVKRMRAEDGAVQFFARSYDTKAEAEVDYKELGGHVWEEDAGNGAWSMNTEIHLMPETGLYQLSVTIWPFDINEPIGYVPDVL